VRSQAISLLDAYICSGHFAIQSLPAEEFAPTQGPIRRRFQDGLESEDEDEDTVFLLWYLLNIAVSKLPF
jgi:Pleckstrin homology domain